jgi:hypothetical protein
MATATLAPNTITIDVLKDLTNASQLKTLLTSNQSAIFSIASELGQYASQPIQAAIGSKPAQLVIQTNASWKTSTGIGFSLTPKASCTIAIGKTSTKFSVAKSIESSDTQDIYAGPADGITYLNIELDFDIKSNVSGSGNVSGVGIAGKASGSASATFSYCHPVSSTTNTVDAIKQAFSNLVFPFETDCALVMPPGSIGKVNFDGSIDCELSVSYGFGSYKFSAPGVDSARQSMQVGLEKFTLPSVDVEAGAKATFTYTHTDHFGAIVTKTDTSAAALYLVRSAQNETGISAGITVGISSSGNLSANIDKQLLTQAVNKVTGGGGGKVATIADQLQSSLVSKANQWLSSEKSEAGLMISLSKQTNRTMLFAFDVKLANSNLTKESWEQFAKGDLRQAAGIGGMTLRPGSGVGNEMKKSVAIDLHFFNLFKFVDTNTYFRNSYVEIGSDGSVRFLYDIGKEKDLTTKTAMEKSKIHFVATANNNAPMVVQNAVVDLYIELSETNNAGEATKIADAIGSLPPSSQVQAAQTTMRTFISTNKLGTLNLTTILKPSAYQKLACSQYTGPKHDLPPALPQEQDKDNWDAFKEATDTLLQLSYVADLTYLGWEQFNLISNGKARGVPDRRSPGDPAAVPPSFFGNLQNVREFVSYFYVSSAEFMNLCDDLHALAGMVGQINTDTQWDDLLTKLTWLVSNDINNDWSKPAARAILKLCSGVNVAATLQPGNKSLTCIVTLS